MSAAAFSSGTNEMHRCGELSAVVLGEYLPVKQATRAHAAATAAQ